MTRPLAIAWAATLLTVGGVTQGPPPDRDGDGLSDFHEVHRYRTDPDRKDSDGDGVPDGDWRERREYQYTVRAVVQVMRPVTIGFLNDDYQDVRVLDETETYVEMEVILYPFNTVARAIKANPRWREDATRMKAWTAPGPTNDWDPAMRAQLIAMLARDGIDTGKLDDRTLVEKASHWLLGHARYHDGFSTFITAFDERGEPFIPDDLRDRAARGMRKSGTTIAEQWRREISAKGMFELAARGSCSSSSIYLNGCLRALGIPTRTVLCIPIVDNSDPRELELLRDGLTHRSLGPKVRRAIDRIRGTWASHTFNEVFVGGRWVRLNYDRLGQNIYDPGLFGLMIHTATFSDWSDARMAETVGRRQNGGPHRDVFGGRNPYSTIALRDAFGPHCSFANPVAATPAEGVRVTDVSWGDREGTPKPVRAWFQRNNVFGLVATIEGLDSAAALREFLGSADLDIELQSSGVPRLDVGLDARNWWFDGVRQRALVVVPFAAAARRNLVVGTRYRIDPRNKATAGWTVASHVTVRR